MQPEETTAIEAAKLKQYYEYLSNGGTMSLEEWERDGRFDKSYEGVEH
jgi:hypothetical protein